jgi:hypothetical protein
MFRAGCLVFLFLAARVALPQRNGDEIEQIVACMFLAASTLCWWLSDLFMTGGKG